jgi:hypothetical protein
MSLAEHQFTLRRETSKEKVFRYQERAEVDKSEEHGMQ